MGYNSSPATAFLMTLFNVRLGAWLPNPAYAMRLAAQTAERVKGLRVVAERSGPAAKAHAREETRAQRFSAASGPRYAIAPLMDELLGRAGTESQFVYLSDGGHFENLGIYEMVRRRCRYILVSDAGCDPECAFADLGNAVRKIAIDLHVPITFERIRITARGKCGKDTVGFALARIAYPQAGGDKSKHGWLLYIKPTYLRICRSTFAPTPRRTSTSRTRRRRTSGSASRSSRATASSGSSWPARWRGGGISGSSSPACAHRGPGPGPTPSRPIERPRNLPEGASPSGSRLKGPGPIPFNHPRRW